MKHPKTAKECKHKTIKRFHQYIGGDCYIFIKFCNDCGKKSIGWTKEEAERGDLK